MVNQIKKKDKKLQKLFGKSKFICLFLEFRNDKKEYYFKNKKTNKKNIGLKINLNNNKIIYKHKWKLEI